MNLKPPEATAGAARRRAFALVFGALALGLAPDAAIRPADWAAANLIVADGPRAGNRWDPQLTPQMVEILDCLSADHPAVRVSVRKSSQVGFTEGAIAWLAASIDGAPCRGLVVFPTVGAVKEFNREKLQPSIEATPKLRAKVRENVSRSSEGSTALSKRFPGGSLVLTGANSSADLRSKTVKIVLADEIDDWVFDLDGQGDPMDMVDARQIAHHATADYKKLEGSTPTIKGASRIDAAFAVGDQRYWRVPCPHCGVRQRLVFEQLKFAKTFPHNAVYACAHCGSLIEHHQKRAMVLAGAWVAEAPGPGRHPSFHLDALTSLLTTWDKIAEKAVAAEGDSQKMKAFANLWLGQAFEEKGEAPDHERLFERRESYPFRRLVPGVLFVTAATDVQKDRLEYAVYGWARDLSCWLVDSGVIMGDPSLEAAWRQHDEVLLRRYEDAWGRTWPVDAWGVDSSYLSAAVYRYCRTHAASHRVFALDGRPGWRLAPLGSPSVRDVDFQGRKLGAVKLWPVGTWDMKSEHYAALRNLLQGPDGDGRHLPATAHFNQLCDREFFQQLTAEFLAMRQLRAGYSVPEWRRARPRNEQLDIAVYARALAHHLCDGLSEANWLALVAARLGQQEPQADMAAYWAPGLATATVATPPTAPATAPATRPAPPTPRKDWVGGRGHHWFRA